MKYGLLGRSLTHSYSVQIHNLLGNENYQLFEIEPEQLEQFMKSADFDGINVTVPYKKKVIDRLDELTPIAAKLGAVNTVVRKEGKLIGHNTDFHGFQTMLTESGLDVCSRKVLVLGSGGASATAVAVLQELGAKVTVISRRGADNYETIANHSDAYLIVNATPVGMYPNNGDSPVDLSIFPCLAGVLDMIYNPSRTRLLQQAEKRGLVTANGLTMLVAQAKESAEFFFGSRIRESLISEIADKLASDMSNLILIGMPGCGKTTVGKLLAQKTGRRFIDADKRIIHSAGMEIPEIFARGGEAAFRKIETEVLEELTKQSGIVLATGGGCVTREANYSLLHQNGQIFWLQRDTSRLTKQGRPLSQAGDLNEMFSRRASLYAAFADHIIDNNGSFEDTVLKILEVIS